MTANRLSTTFAGVELKNPVILASGTCGFGREYAEIFDIERLGGLSVKGLTLNARAGNDGIRVWETPSGVMNSVGLENPGVKGFMENELGWLNGLDTAVIVNLGGHSLNDYIEGAELLDEADFDLLELNISCPNLKAGGMSFGLKAETAREVVRKVRSVCSRKLAVKLSPNAEDIVALARVCEEEGADALTLVNTFLAMAVDIENRKPVFENVYAGLSGPAIKPIALRMVHQVAGAVSIPVMGAGGISTWRDAVEFIMAGAAAVQIGTANFMKPDISLDIIDGLGAFAEKNGLDNLSDIRGCLVKK